MKKKILVLVSIVALFALSIAAYAYTQTSEVRENAVACSCCKDDSCPMKKKDGSATEKTSCCDDCEHCKGDSCPMKKKDGSHSTASHTEHADGDCCCACCKDKKKDGPA